MKEKPSAKLQVTDTLSFGESAVLTAARIERGTWLLMFIFSLYCVVGLTGFEPSKQDEGYIFGIMLEYWHGQNWAVPSLAGQPFMEKPPLFYLVGLACMHLFSPWLPLHDAARLASGFCTGVTALAVAGCARLGWGQGYGRCAVLALFGSLGLIVPSHMLLTDNAQLTGIAVALLGFTGFARRRSWAGFALGTGAGIAFLSKGLYGIGLIGLTAVLLPLLFSDWRSRAYVVMLGAAALFCLPWLLVWPIHLYQTAPSLFSEWLWINNFGRFLGFAPPELNAVHQSDFWYRVLPWATFPVLPMALVACWRLQVLRRCYPAVQLSAAFCLAMLIVMATSSSVRAIYALPLLPALALVAAPVVREPPPWLERLLQIGSWLLFGVAAGFWLLWMSASLRIDMPFGGALGRWSGGADMPARLFGASLAVVLCAAWFYCRRVWRAVPWRAAAYWNVGVVSMMALASWLWIPWIAAEKSSYRALFEQLSEHLPEQGCVASRGLGESQRGLLDYWTGVKTVRRESKPDVDCAALLLDGRITQEPAAQPGWRLVWSGRRSADDREKFWLFVKGPQAEPSAPVRELPAQVSRERVEGH